MLKKILVTCLILSFIFINLSTIVFAEGEITLSNIATTFNNCKTVKENGTSGSVWNASFSGNKLTIAVTGNNTNVNLEYVLEDGILTANFSESEGFAGFIVTTVLTDSIGQLHGYSDGELMQTLNSDEIVNYSVENEGFEVKQLTEGSYQVKIDINKKIPLINMDNKYFEVSDLEDLKNYISGNGSAEKSKGNVWFNKSGYNGQNTLLIAEKGELTENAYKSVISILQVMFDSNKPAAYFKTTYPDFSSGDKEFNGFKIEVNPTKTEFEESLIPSDSGYEFARITIDKDKVNSELSGNIINDKEENEGQKPQDKPNNDIKEEVKDEVTTSKKEDNTQISGKLPQTGVSMSIAFISLSAIIIAIVCYKKYRNYKI